jgi:hypothetical protein
MAPVKGPRGLIVIIAECEPGNGPGLHRHLNTVEPFFASPAAYSGTARAGGDSELCGGGVVLKNLSEQVRECLRHAMIVREKLPLKLIHTNFLDLEQR